MLAPLLWTLLLSLKDNAELVGNSGAALHAPYTLENYAAIFGNSSTMRWLLNSAIVALGTTAACSSSPASPATASPGSTSRSAAPCS
jgi:multiple sugar transport system permease protein